MNCDIGSLKIGSTSTWMHAIPSRFSTYLVVYAQYKEHETVTSEWKFSYVIHYLAKPNTGTQHDRVVSVKLS